MSVRSLLVATGVGLTAAIGGSPMVAHAQDSATRDAAIKKCVMAAHSQYKGGDADNEETGRTAVYTACMTKAGFKP